MPANQKDKTESLGAYLSRERTVMLASPHKKEAIRQVSVGPQRDKAGIGSEYGHWQEGAEFTGLSPGA